ncbi:MAG TPA: tetratricopeptide repeat protein [Beutenbergiaceae bacterium]|nr:tetratricopeptide repeat protein [Beutenbergiaceae bacterium]
MAIDVSEHSVADVEVTSGYIIRGSDLRGHVTDVAAFQRAHQDDPATPVLIALSEHRFDDAMQMLDDLLSQEPDSLRYRALRGDVLRDQGQLDAAEAVYSDLVARTSADPGRGPMMRQHRAKVYFHQGRLAEAETEFRAVLAAREAARASADQIASTRQALQRVRSELARRRVVA